MFEQFENMLLNPLVEKLNAHGIKIDAETIKKAVANSPQIVTQIEAILMSSNSQEKLEKIKALITQASGGTTADNSKTTTTSTK